jgi:Tol biopolymer transport system component
MARRGEDFLNALKLLCLLCLFGSPLYGQFTSFGKNKVQFDAFSWQKMETPHFDVFFFAQEEELASYAAHMAERQYRDLEKKFAHTVQRRVPLIVYSSHIYFEQTNIIPNLLPEGVAGFTEYLKGRVALPLSGSLPDFERVLHHELVHVFTFDRIARVLERHGIHDFRPAPLWFTEGLAEYWSSEWSTFGDMIIRDALFAHRLVPIAQMHLIYGTFQMYKEGESICHFMAERHGEDVFEQLFQNWWRAEEFEEVFLLTTGETLQAFDEAWNYRVRKRYLPDIAVSDAPSQMAKARTGVGFNIKPTVIPNEADSLSFVYFTNAQGYTQIALQRGESDPEIVVAGERLPLFESLHPLSTKIAVAPDGGRIAFAAKSRGRDHLYLWDLVEKRELADLHFAELVAISSPSFAPDGRRIVFSGARQSGMVDLFIADVESGHLEALTDDIYHDRQPTWSPDGERIAFSSDRFTGGRDGRYNLFIYEVSTGRIRHVDGGDHNDQQPAFSPDGRSIAFSSDREGIFDLYVADLDSAQAATRRLTHVLTGAFDPVWRADGEGLLFSGFQGGGFQIYEVDVGWDDSTAVVHYPIVEAVAEPWALEGRQEERLFALRPYSGKMTLDIAQSQISQDPEFGTSGGIQLALSDVLGNDQYAFVLSHIAGSQTGFFDGLNVALSRYHLGQRLNWGWGLFRLNDRFSSTFGRFVREKRTGGFVGLSYPFSRHDRVETRLSLRHAEIDRQFEGRRLSGWLANNFLSYTHDSSLWLPTGPIEGKRYSLGVGQTVDFKSSRRFNTTLFGDYRHYFRLSSRTSWAMRYMGRHSLGDVPEYFSLGGSWTLRGYPWRSLWGSKMVLINQELRFPLVDRLIIGFPFGSINFSAFRGALFVDAGNAWNDAFDQWRGALGAGMRLALGGVFVFRLDAARRTDFTEIGNDTHWDFFFGWDF